MPPLCLSKTSPSEGRPKYGARPPGKFWHRWENSGTGHFSHASSSSGKTPKGPRNLLLSPLGPPTPPGSLTGGRTAAAACTWSGLGRAARREL